MESLKLKWQFLSVAVALEFHFHGNESLKQLYFVDYSS
jgi:hypothetical protein